MSLEKIFETLDEEAEYQRKELLGKAEAEAKKIVQEAEDEARKIAKNSIDKMDILLRIEKSRLQTEIELAKKRKIAKAKDEYTTRIYEDIEKYCKKLRDNPENHKKVFKNLFLESLNEAHGSKDIVIMVNNKDKELAAKVLSESSLNYEVKVVDNSFSGGLCLQVEGNRIVIYNTFESRLEKAKKILLAQLTEVLFSA